MKARLSRNKIPVLIGYRYPDILTIFCLIILVAYLIIIFTNTA